MVGTFRSGTNLTKHCLKTHFQVDPVFSEWFWKHGLPPTLIKVPIPPTVPIIVLSRDPIELNVALYRFWQARRPELYLGENISQFVRRRFITYDNTGGNVCPQYYHQRWSVDSIVKCNGPKQI